MKLYRRISWINDVDFIHYTSKSFFMKDIIFIRSEIEWEVITMLIVANLFQKVSLFLIIEWEVITVLSVAYLFHKVSLFLIIISEHIDVFRMSLEICCGKNWAFAVEAIHRELFAVPHYCRICNIPSVALVAQIIGWMV